MNFEWVIWSGASMHAIELSRVSLSQPAMASEPGSRRLIKPQTDTVHFSGIVLPQAKSMLVFDLDGTFADLDDVPPDDMSKFKTPEEMLDANIEAFYQYSQKANAHMVYASARTLEDFQRFQKKLSDKGVNLKTPDYYIGNNGNFMYKKNDDGDLVEITAYADVLKEKTGFDRQAIYDTLHALGHQPNYKLKTPNPQPATPHKKDGPPFTEFEQSQLAYYEFLPSDFFLEYMYSADAHEQIEKGLPAALDKLGMKYSLTWNKFPRSNIDWIQSMSEDPKFAEIIRLARPLRVDADGGLYTVHISAAKKAHAIEYLMERLSIPHEEVVMAGNDMNDLSMAEMTRKGSWFITVASASDTFKEKTKSLYMELIMRGEHWSSLLQNTVLYDGNESIRHGFNCLTSWIKDRKVDHYRDTITRVRENKPDGDLEEIIHQRFNSDLVQQELEERKNRIFMSNMMTSASDCIPEGAGWYIAEEMAAENILVELIEETSQFKPFRLNLPENKSNDT